MSLQPQHSQPDMNPQNQNQNPQNQNPAQQQLPVKLEPNILAQVIHESQAAQLRGATDLPTRDILRDTTRLTHDPMCQPDYIPAPRYGGYIPEYEGGGSGLGSGSGYQPNLGRNGGNYDKMFRDFYAAVQLAIIYFVFQMPIVRETLCLYAPSLVQIDGQYNLRGYIAISSIFACVYLSWTRAIAAFPTIRFEHKHEHEHEHKH